MAYQSSGMLNARPAAARSRQAMTIIATPLRKMTSTARRDDAQEAAQRRVHQPSPAAAPPSTSCTAGRRQISMKNMPPTQAMTASRWTAFSDGVKHRRSPFGAAEFAHCPFAETVAELPPTRTKRGIVVRDTGIGERRRDGMTKLCSVCGTENREEAQFCRSCGTAFPPPAPAFEDESQLGTGITCDECSFQNKPGVRYCANCGVSLLGTVIVPRGRAAASPPDPYAGTSPPPISYPSYAPVAPYPPPPVERSSYPPVAGASYAAPPAYPPAYNDPLGPTEISDPAAAARRLRQHRGPRRRRSRPRHRPRPFPRSPLRPRTARR